MFGARFSVWGARSADEANANVPVLRFSVWGARSADEANANVRCKV